MLNRVSELGVVDNFALRSLWFLESFTGSLTLKDFFIFSNFLVVGLFKALPVEDTVLLICFLFKLGKTLLPLDGELYLEFVLLEFCEE